MSVPVRVLHYGMSPNMGGIESFIMNIYRNIDRNKIQFDFLTFAPNIVFAEEIEKLGGEIFFLNLPSRKENPIENHRQINTFFKEHTEYKNVHFHFNTCSYIKPLEAASKMEGRKIILHGHSNWIGKSISTKFLHYLHRKKAIEKSNYLLAVSEDAGNFMYGKNGVKHENYKVLNNGIDALQYRYDSNIRLKVRKELNLENKFVVGHVGRLSYPKNHDFLLDIFEQIHRVNKNAVLILVGSGELEDTIKSKIEFLGLSQSVMMLGVRNDVAKLLQAMDVFVFPSHFEGLGLAVIEAQASSLPCIIADTIPREAYVTNLVESISLDVPAKEWADNVLKYQDSDTYIRKDTYSEIVNAGFDISELVSFLEKVYLS